MTEDSKAILRLLEEGKITVEEAEHRLRAAGDRGAGRPGPDDRPESDAAEGNAGGDDAGESDAGSHGARESEGHEGDAGARDRDLFDSISDGIGRAFKAVQDIDVDEVVGKAFESVNEAVDAAQRSETGRFLSDVADQVAETVASAADTGEKVEEVEAREWEKDDAGLTRIRAETSNGGIGLKGTDGPRVRVRARITVRAKDRAAARNFCSQVEVQVEEAGDELQVRREHPKPPKGMRVEVAYEIECPARLRAVLRTLNGRIGVEGMAAEVDAETANGHVNIDGGRGRVLARTKNGAIRARVDALSEEGQFSTLNGRIEVDVAAGQAPVQARTLNGSVELCLPRDFDGQLDARTTNGRVRSDFPVAVTGEVKKNHLQGPIGRGGHSLIDLRTVNGSVSLKRPAEA